MFVSGGRPQDHSTLHRTGDRDGRTWPSPPDDVGVQLHRRRAAALRCEPLAVVGWRDPLGRYDGHRAPCDYGLTSRELAGEWSRLIAAGWPPAEVALVLLPPSVEVAA
jgi:hypothetical protein